MYCPFTGIEQVFPCRRWLDEDDGDGLVEVELYEMVSLRQCKQKSKRPFNTFNMWNVGLKTLNTLMVHICAEFPWSLWIWTSDIKGAGTDAQIFIQVYGDKGKSDEMKLESKSDSFEQAQCDKFLVLHVLSLTQKII